MDGPLVPEVADPAVIDLRADVDEQPAKKRRVREKLPKPHVDSRSYGSRFCAGRTLFKTEYANEERLRSLYPTHYALDGTTRNGVLICTQRLQGLLWAALSPDEIREWNNKVEPDYEANEIRRLEEQRAIQDAAIVAQGRHRHIFKTIWSSKITSHGGCFLGYNFGEPVDRDTAVADFARAYDAAAAEYDGAAHHGASGSDTE